MTQTVRETVPNKRQEPQLTFFFDPICPWAWRASQWVREVRRQRPLQIDWRLFSLGITNGYGNDNPMLLAPLRVLALVERRDGNAAVDRLYEAMGCVIHESHVNIREDGALERAVEQALSDAGCSADLLRQAVNDPSTLEDVVSEQRRAVERYGAYGVPWLVLGNRDFGFNGPVIDTVPRDGEALQLWEHISWLLTQPYFFEIKRERQPVAAAAR